MAEFATVHWGTRSHRTAFRRSDEHYEFQNRRGNATLQDAEKYTYEQMQPRLNIQQDEPRNS